MPTLSDTDIGDLVTGTLKELGRLRFNQIATRLQNYEVMGRLMKKDKVQFDSGVGIQRTIMVDHSAAAKQVGLYATDQVNVADVLATIDIPWRHTTVNYAYERREILMNRGPERIVDILKVRRADAMISLTELMEDQFWSAPGGTSDKLNVFGLFYWLVYNATEGFNGGNHASYSSGPGNLDSSVYTRWKNYTANYTLVNKQDLVSKMRTAYRKIRFKSPVSIPDFRNGAGDQYRIYVNETTLKGLEDLGESQNENLGRDLASMDGVMTFRRNPIVWVPKLDANANNTDPVIMLDFGQFYPVFLKGDYLRETQPERTPNQHNVWAIHVDTTWNVLCSDRRCQAIIAKG